MSNNNKHLFQQVYNTWGEALGAYLDEKFGQRGSRSKLARMLLGDEADDNKVKSKASEVGRWINQGVTPIDRTKEDVHNLLNICITENREGDWAISRTKKGQSKEPDSKYSIDELLQEERSRLGIQDIPDTERGRELQGMLDDAVSLVLKIRRSIEMEKRRADN